MRALKERNGWTVALKAIGTSAFVAAALIGSAQADVAIARDPSSECTVTVTNQITAADAARVQSSSSCSRVLLILSGPGGDARAAMTIGRWAREREAVSVVYENTYCYSSCALTFIGGVERANFGAIGLHRPYLAGAPLPEAEVAKNARTMLDQVRRYVEEMGVTSEFANAMVNTPPSEVRIYHYDITSLVPLTDPLFDEVKVARLARRFGITTEEFRKREQAAEACPKGHVCPLAPGETVIPLRPER
jgi:hypothetical protein